MKAFLRQEHRQIREHLEIIGGRSITSLQATMPWINDARESIVSMSRRLTTLIIKKSKKGGLDKNAIK